MGFASLGPPWAREEAIGDVRGLGLMTGIEFRDVGRTPATERVKRVLRACVDRGLLLLTCGYRDQVIRWIPPLVVKREQIDEALEIFGDALSGAEAAKAA
jgi:4-aminobutyrate aminotransferase